MRLIKTMTKKDLLLSCVDLISKTYIELGQHNIEEETIEVMARSLAKDLNRIYKNFYFEDAENAFDFGVSSPINTSFIHLNRPIYVKWLRDHKDSIWDARARVDQGESPEHVLHYRPEPKLLK